MQIKQAKIVKKEEIIKNKLLIFRAWVGKIPANKTIAKQIKYLFSLAQNIVANRPLVVLSPNSNKAVCYFLAGKKLWRLPIRLPRPLLNRPLNLPQLYEQSLGPACSDSPGNNPHPCLLGGANDEIWACLIKEGQKLKVNGKPILQFMEKFYSLLRAYRPEIKKQKMPLMVARYTYRALIKHEATILGYLAQIITRHFAAQEGWYSVSAYGELICPFVCLENSQPKKLIFSHSASFDPTYFWEIEITAETFFTNLAYHYFG